MKSPYTGKEMRASYEQDTWQFRNEEYKCFRLYWYDDANNERFTTDAGDDAAYNQVTNQYRERYGIPYTDEIVALRKRYGLSASKMSKLLGFGVNQYRMYEDGEVPNISNGRLIKSAMNPKVMLALLEDSKNALKEKEYLKIKERIDKIIDNHILFKTTKYEIDRIYNQRGIENGFGELSLERLKTILLYILNNCGTVWVTKLNKLLFYLDFCSYRNFGQAMTGLSYRAIDYGPVPNRWEKVYSEFDEISQLPRLTEKYCGNIILTEVQEVDLSYLAEREIKLLKDICAKLGKMSSSQLTKLSHQEELWKKYCDNHDFIPFNEAFLIKAL